MRCNIVAVVSTESCDSLCIFSLKEAAYVNLGWESYGKRIIHRLLEASKRRHKTLDYDAIMSLLRSLMGGRFC